MSGFFLSLFGGFYGLGFLGFFNTRRMQIILSHISSAWSKPKYSALDSGLIWTLMHTIGFWFSVSVTEENKLLSRDGYLHHLASRQASWDQLTVSLNTMLYTKQDHKTFAMWRLKTISPFWTVYWGAGCKMKIWNMRKQVFFQTGWTVVWAHSKITVFYKSLSAKWVTVISTFWHPLSGPVVR